MPALVAGTHAFTTARKAWITGTSPVMTGRTAAVFSRVEEFGVLSATEPFPYSRGFSSISMKA